MTYYELFTKAENLLIHNKISLGEYDKMVQPLNEEVRKEGRWIHDIHYGLKLPEHRCSICGEWEYSDTESKYCPNCGAYMGGE